MVNKEARIEELEYVLNMYKKTVIIVEAWNIEELKQRIKDTEQKLDDVKGGLNE